MSRHNLTLAPDRISDIEHAATITVTVDPSRPFNRSGNRKVRSALRATALCHFTFYRPLEMQLRECANRLGSGARRRR